MTTDQISFYDGTLKKQIEGSYVGREHHLAPPILFGLTPASQRLQSAKIAQRTNHRSLDAGVNQVQVPGREDDRHVWA